MRTLYVQKICIKLHGAHAYRYEKCFLSARREHKSNCSFAINLHTRVQGAFS
jgi:hypothetical protein